MKGIAIHHKIEEKNENIAPLDFLQEYQVVWVVFGVGFVMNAIDIHHKIYPQNGVSICENIALTKRNTTQTIISKFED